MNYKVTVTPIEILIIQDVTPYNCDSLFEKAATLIIDSISVEEDVNKIIKVIENRMLSKSS